MVFGGSQHPDQDDRFAWLAHEEEFLREVLAARVPVFGVCLGAQMLARAAGAAVGPASAPEIGWLEVALTPPGAPIPCSASSREATVFQWHHYTFDVPPRRDRARAQQRLHAGVPARGQPAWGSSSTPR